MLLEHDLFEQLRDVTGDKGARNLLLSVQVRDIPCDDLGGGEDVDTPRRARRPPGGRPRDGQPAQMKLEQSFEVRAPVERVWETLIDVERVAPCLPGAEITEAGDDGIYRGTFSVRLGPTTAAYRGKLQHAGGRRGGPPRGHERERPGQARPRARPRPRSSARCTRRASLTRVDVETDFTITGRLARFGRGGMIQDISNRLLKDFADCVQQRIEAPPAAEPGVIDADARRDPGGRGGRTASPRAARTRPPRRSRSAASRSSSGRYSTGSAGCSAAAEIVSGSHVCCSSRRYCGSIVCGIGDSR